MITRLRLENFRGFINTQDLAFGKINLFYGPNSGGKSTVLRALSLLKQSFAHNNVDPLCVLLPYSRDGVDMGSATSLHHNLDISIPFSISLSTSERESKAIFRIARSQPTSLDEAKNAPSPRSKPTTEGSREGDSPASYRQWLKAFPGVENTNIYFDEPSPEWTLRLSIADDEQGSSSVLRGIRFGNSHFMIYASEVAPSGGRARAAFMDQLQDIVHHAMHDETFEVFGEIGKHSTRRRYTQRQVARFHRSTQVSIDDEFYASGCYSVDSVVLSGSYETALGNYFTDCREDIVAFSKAVLGDLTKLKLGEKGTTASSGLAADDFRSRLQDYFAVVVDCFTVTRDAADYVAWWREDLRRSRLLLFGYANAEYDSDDIPPLAYWMTSDWWTAWRMQRGALQQQGLSFLPDGQCDDLDDVVSVYASAVEVSHRSLNAIRDIGPDRSSAERVYRIEPRQHAARDHVGRRATEIPRLLFESPRLLDELNAWLKSSGVPYRLIVDALEIRGGGGGDVRQTGLFELNAELAHSRNARINLSDVGHGLFKQLALPIQSFLGRNLIITIEEPETNVHPRLQAEIADLFIDAVLKRGHQVFAEAHSEILALRLRRRINEGVISHEDVRLFYVHAPDNGPCVVLPLEIDRKGRLKNEPPGGFFDEWLNEV